VPARWVGIERIDQLSRGGADGQPAEHEDRQWQKHADNGVSARNSLPKRAKRQSFGHVLKTRRFGLLTEPPTPDKIAASLNLMPAGNTLSPLVHAAPDWGWAAVK
jgi:hypothetical protein